MKREASVSVLDKKRPTRAADLRKAALEMLRLLQKSGRVEIYIIGDPADAAAEQKFRNLDRRRTSCLFRSRPDFRACRAICVRSARFFLILITLKKEENVIKLLAHGILHLLGYDHKKEATEQKWKKGKIFMAQNVITGLDIGSNSIKAVVLEAKKTASFRSPRRLKAVRPACARERLPTSPTPWWPLPAFFGELKEISRDAARNVFLGIGDTHVKAHVSRGIIAVSRADNEISKDDVERVGQTAQTMLKLSPNRTIIHNIPREYIVDGVGGVGDPSGMIGGRLEADCLIIDAFSPAVKNLTKCVEEAGGNVSGMIFNPFASARSILTKNQKISEPF